MGDFNFPTINWSDMQTKQSHLSASYEFLEFLQDYDLSQHVLKPTRHRLGQKSSLLDLLISSSEIQMSPISHEAPLGRSDHDILTCQMDMDFCVSLPNTARPNFRKADYLMINDMLACIDWAAEFEALDVDSQLALLEDFINRIIKNFIPLTYKSENSHPVWSDRDVRLLVNKKKRAYNCLRKEPTPSNLAAFKAARNAAVDGIRRSRKLYEGNLIKNSKSQPKALFTYINSKRSNVVANCLKNSKGAICLDDSEIVSEFNQFFASTLKQTALSPPSTDHHHGEANFTVSDVHSSLLTLKDDTAWGPDGISPIFIKNCAATLAVPFFQIFSTSIRTCTFPARWKTANITPVYKAGSKHDVKNYRPISLLSIVSKILERFVHSDLMLKCKELNILPESQHGFLPGRSCLTNLLNTYNTITRLVDGGVSCDMIYLDFSKAFDSVSHTKLIRKLSFFGFPPTLISWLHSYLYARRQRVCLRGSVSEWSVVTSGVPQGSVLGPLLFNIYISDLPKIISSDNCSYADDMKLYSPSYLCDVLQKDLQNVVDWASANALELNPAKCAVLYFGHNNPHSRYFIGTQLIPTKSSHLDLGILVDDTLKFHQHAEYVTAKVVKKAHYILRSFTSLNAHLFSVLFKTFLRPVLEYCSQVSRPCYTGFSSRLETCQRRLTKWCRQIKHLPYQNRLQQLNLPSVETRLKRGDLILTYQILNQCMDVDPSDYFCLTHTNTRGHNFRLCGSTANLHVRHRFFTERVISLWNSLPSAVVSATTLNAFKARLDCFL
jgi:hypothetical protein